MSKKSKSNTNVIGLLFKGIFRAIWWLINGILDILAFFIVIIIFLVWYHKYDYGKKSGNGFFKTIFNTGNMGEFRLYVLVAKIFGKENVLTNIYLPATTIDTTEIDVLAISKKAVYCFEMKNYKGYIYGKGTDNYWTQVLNRNSKYKLYNPVKQNDAHVKALMECLDIERDLIADAVIFGKKSHIDRVNTESPVFKIAGTKEFIKTLEKPENTDVMTEEQVKSYLDKLSGYALASDKTKEEHVRQIEEKYYFKDKNREERHEHDGI